MCIHICAMQAVQVLCEWQNHDPALHFQPPPLLSLCRLGSSAAAELQRAGSFMGDGEKGSKLQEGTFYPDVMTHNL